MEVVARANPRPEMTPGRLRKKRESPTMTREHWLRFVCNIATLSGGSAFQPEEWDRLEESPLEIPDGTPRLGWLDLGWKIDTTAMGVLVWESDERRLVTGVRVLEPPVDESDIVAGILRIQLDLGVDMWVADPSAGAEQMIQLLEKGQHPLQTDDDVRAEHDLPPLTGDEAPLEFVAHSQDNAPMSQAASGSTRRSATAGSCMTGTASCALTYSTPSPARSGTRSGSTTAPPTRRATGARTTRSTLSRAC
jgi:hypothetical protein